MNKQDQEMVEVLAKTDCPIVQAGAPSGDIGRWLCRCGDAGDGTDPREGFG